MDKNYYEQRLRLISLNSIQSKKCQIQSFPLQFSQPWIATVFRISREHFKVGFLAEWPTWSVILFIRELVREKTKTNDCRIKYSGGWWNSFDQVIAVQRIRRAW